MAEHTTDIDRLRVLLIALLVAALQFAGAFTPLSDALSDMRFGFLERPASGNLVIVEIDAPSIRRIGTWPWSRDVYARAIDRLVELGADDIAIDVDFSSASSPEGDAALEAALARAGGIASLAAFRDAGGRSQNLVAPLARFAANAATACVDVKPDADGRVRSYLRAQATATGPCVTMPVLVAGGAGDLDRPYDIDFSIDPRTIERVSLADLVAGTVPRERIAGRKVLVGATAVELRDFFLVPVWGNIPGVLLQGIATETLIQDRALSPAPAALAYAGLFLVVLIGFALARRQPLHRSLVVIGLAAFILEAGAVVMQIYGTVNLDTAACLSALAMLAILVVARELGLGRLRLTLSRAETREVWAMLTKVVEESFTGIIVADSAGRIRAASRETAELLGLPRGKKLTGLNLAAVLPRPLREAVERTIGAAGEGVPPPREPVEIDCSAEGCAPLFLEYALTMSVVDRKDAGWHREPGVALCVMIRDVTKRKIAQDHVERLARYDALTDIPNRNLFFEQLSATVRRSSGGALGVAHFDLDGFKTVNDSFGHNVGDDLLRAVAQRLNDAMRPGALFARLGGDEFAVLLSSTAGQARRALFDLGSTILAAMEKPFQIGPYEIMTSASIGLAQHDDAETVDELMKKADAALYQAKRAGGADARFYDAELDARIRERAAMQEELKLALNRQELSVVYQPQIDLASRRLIGVEALLRWRSPTRGSVSPAEFIPIAEQTGMMPALGEFVLSRACQDAAHWPPDVRVSVNVSSVQFERSDLVGIVERTLRDSGLAATRLGLEITESLFIQNAETVSSMLARLRSIGVEIALDDFGTGYSSLGYIRRFPIDTIKIDQSFVRGLPLDVESTAIIRAILSMGESLRLKVVAEGIETPEQEELLRFAGCREGQGYLFGKPASANVIRDTFFGNLNLASV
jgi:diguanylate cyclase (GGDEF)-like protein/PAS domain S-box-containing protein